MDCSVVGLLSSQLLVINGYIREMEFPVWESVLLLVLTIITFFRRELSSNSRYRENQARKLDGVSLMMDRASISQMMHAEVIRSPFTSMERMRQDMVETLKDKLNEYANYPFDTMIPRRESEDLGREQRTLDLANDIVLHVVKFMDISDIMNLSEVDFKLGFMCTSDLLWKRRWFEDYGQVWQDQFLQEIVAERGIKWDPRIMPVQGWKRFCIEFEYAWVGCLLAGFNTEERCLIGVEDKILDVTDFLPKHPGSSETLLDVSGQDVSQIFEEIGHSIYAKGLSESFTRARFPDPRRQQWPAGFLTKMKRERAIILELAKKGHITSGVTRTHKSDQRTACTGGHRGCVHSFYSPFKAQWYIWWSCCGVQQAIDPARLDSSHNKAVSVSDLMPILSDTASWQ